MSADLTTEEREILRDALRENAGRTDLFGAVHGAVGRILHLRAQAAPLPAEAIAGLLNEHAECNAVNTDGWFCVHTGEPLTTPRAAHQAEVIARAQATAATKTGWEGGPLEGLARAMHDSEEAMDGTRAATRADTDTALAEAWDRGMRTGTSRAMRNISDEPSLPLASAADNPYLRAALGGDPDHSHGRQG